MKRWKILLSDNPFKIFYIKITKLSNKDVMIFHQDTFTQIVQTFQFLYQACFIHNWYKTKDGLEIEIAVRPR